MRDRRVDRLRILAHLHRQESKSGGYDQRAYHLSNCTDRFPGHARTSLGGLTGRISRTPGNDKSACRTAACLWALAG